MEFPSGQLRLDTSLHVHSKILRSFVYDVQLSLDISDINPTEFDDCGRQSVCRDGRLRRSSP